jgi:hypothetical protein
MDRLGQKVMALAVSSCKAQGRIATDCSGRHAPYGYGTDGIGTAVMLRTGMERIVSRRNGCCGVRSKEACWRSLVWQTRIASERNASDGTAMAVVLWNGWVQRGADGLGCRVQEGFATVWLDKDGL